MSNAGGATGSVSERTTQMFLDVEWTDQEGRHQGKLTDELEEFNGKPIILTAGGRQFTATTSGASACLSLALKQRTLTPWWKKPRTTDM
jgi:hypothetical protein